MAVNLLLSEEDTQVIGSKVINQLGAVYNQAYPGFSITADISLVNLEEIQALNRQYRDLDEPTDVLSFPTVQTFKDIQAQAQKSDLLIGSIVISPEKAEIYQERLIDLVHHGLLHLFGFDHETEGVQWNEEEQRILGLASATGLYLKGIPHDSI